jgi:AcrR family transcriptional regulator
MAATTDRLAAGKPKTPARRARAPARTAKSAQRGGKRAAQGGAKREAILKAALAEFSSGGFAATRLDDVARRAGVAKGTIYLYFADKEALFQEIVRSMLTPLIGQLEDLRRADAPFRETVERIVSLFISEVLETERRHIIRLIIAEGPRFPKIAEFHYREVVSRAMQAMQALLQRALARGEIAHAELARFPQLLFAPALMAIVWNSLFDRFSPLDARALLNAHLGILLSERTAS